ncbi:hypothetical protein BS47DRAFT_1391321 [Hydnum rufescens UP504]|uniref:Uncharacterized protein n=1 Tax=Hydnum rufescens UP504 TaxID=1448309 RepID=A0A9P6B1B8_9AGAM|nr:hypothetical protein BS47DRAFT_1391321 [Hydnum rufescens UP504]
MLAPHCRESQSTPEIRTHLIHIIPLGIINGPKSPQDFNSFLQPFIDECKQLAHGIRAFDATSNDGFDLHIYPLSVNSDMQAIKHVTYLKGIMLSVLVMHARYGLCAMHERVAQLTMSHCVNQMATMSSHHHGTLMNFLTEYGINGESDVCEIPSIRLFSSFPHEWMHLFLENHCKNMIKLWTGTFKGLNEGSGEFRISDVVWETIGTEMASSGSTIPSTFARRTPNVWMERHNFTAKDWAFWFLYIGPHVLKDRFPKRKYYVHFMKLREIMSICMQFTISDYEKLYYQYDLERLSTCPLTLHAMLHVTEDIERNSQPCMNWSFVMEHWCGSLLPAVKSCVNPYITLARRQLHLAQLDQILARPLEGEVVYKEYPLSILRRPRQLVYNPDKTIHRKIGIYFTNVFNKPYTIIVPLLPEIMPRWGKVRIAGGGDSIRSSIAQRGLGRQRDASFVRYEVLVDHHDDDDDDDVIIFEYVTVPKKAYGVLW